MVHPAKLSPKTAQKPIASPRAYTAGCETLPFVLIEERRGKKTVLSYWNVMPTGDYVADTKTGERYAKQLLAFMAERHESFTASTVIEELIEQNDRSTVAIWFLRHISLAARHGATDAALERSWQDWRTQRLMSGASVEEVDREDAALASAMMATYKPQRLSIVSEAAGEDTELMRLCREWHDLHRAMEAQPSSDKPGLDHELNALINRRDDKLSEVLGRQPRTLEGFFAQVNCAGVSAVGNFLPGRALLDSDLYERVLITLCAIGDDFAARLNGERGAMYREPGGPHGIIALVDAWCSCRTLISDSQSDEDAAPYLRELAELERRVADTRCTDLWDVAYKLRLHRVILGEGGATVEQEHALLHSIIRDVECLVAGVPPALAVAAE